MKVAQSVKSFLKSVEKRYAEKTYKSYETHLHTFKDALGKKDMTRLTSADVKQWVNKDVYRDGRKKQLSPDSQRAIISAWMQWQKFAVDSGHLKKSLVSEIWKPRGRVRERIPTGREKRAVLRLASREFRRIYLCLIYTGARPSELAGAQVEDYDRKAEMIVLRQHKTARLGRTRRIGVGRKMRRILRRCIGRRKTGLIFLNEKGRKWTTETLSHKYRRLRNKAGLSKDLVLYSTRHATGTAICKKFGIYAASHALGHANVQTTERYMHPDDSMLAKYQDDIFS